MSSTNPLLHYMNTIVNNKENLKELLNIIIQITESTASSIFIKYNNNYTCIEHVDEDDSVNISDIKFNYNIDILDVIFDKDNYIYPKDIHSIMIIPININNINIGIICLLNNVNNYHENILEQITPYISLLQIILEKYKILKEQKNNYNELFLANMSHEIRTPLNGVIGYCQLLMQTNVDITQKQYLESMNQCSIQLMQIINDILDFSKLSSGKMIIHNECFTPQELFDKVFDTMQHKLNEKRQTYTIDISEKMPTFIILDKQKIIQILINLISNSHKFSDIGSNIEIYMTVENEEILLSVKDYGIGISDDNQPKIFNIFEQIQDFGFRTGSGLGLAITKKIINLLGGNIKVQSVLGEWTKFICNIPYQKYKDLQSIIKKDSKILKNKNVLIVDDNTDNRILLSEILFEWEMKPIICASSLEALRLILGNRYKFDMAIIDICMPGISGVELAKEIKIDKPFLPIIALSSIDTFVNLTNFEQKLDKPINKVQLFNSIYTIMSKHKNSTYLEDDDSSSENSVSLKYDKDVKILIAEDILYNRNLLINMLNNLKYTDITCCENGRDTIEMIENNKYDILLLDLKMPIMNGFDVIRYYNNNSLKIPKIVVITASIMENDRQICKQLGVKYFINKPIDLVELKKLMIYITEI